MASETVAQVANRMAKDPTFREAVAADPTTALADYELTDEEKRSLIDGPGAPDLGVDDRTTKFI